MQTTSRVLIAAFLLGGSPYTLASCGGVAAPAGRAGDSFSAEERSALREKVHPAVWEDPLPPLADNDNASVVWAAIPQDALDIGDEVEEGSEIEQYLFAMDAGLPAEPLRSRLSRMLEARREAMERFDSGLARRDLRFDLSDRGTGLDAIFHLRGAVELKRLRMRLLVAEGRGSEALEEQRKIVRLVELLRRPGSPLIVWLVSVSYEETALMESVWLASRREVPRQALEELQVHTADDAGFAQAWRSEFWGVLVPALARMPREGADAAVAEALTSMLFAPAEQGVTEAFRKRLAVLLRGHPSPFHLVETIGLASEQAGRVIEVSRGSWPETAAVRGDGEQSSALSALFSAHLPERAYAEQAAESVETALRGILREESETPAGRIE